MKCAFQIGAILAALLLVGCGEPNADNQQTSGVEPVAVTTANFDEVVLNADKPVLVDFWADWCAPCRKVAPIVKEIAGEYEGRAVVAKLDTDESPELAAKYNVTGIPTLIVFENGEEVSRIVGLQPKSVLTSKLDEALQ